MSAGPEPRGFTGRHLLAILLGGFGVIIAVNLTMAIFAARTFPGLIVENSYVASQEYNKGLEAGRRQREMGWRVTTKAAGDTLIVQALNANGQPLHGASVEAVLNHPLGQAEEVRLQLQEGDDGSFRASHDLPPGRWDVELKIRRDGHDWWAQQRIEVE